jgi:AmmeMemoRadiSam system protein B
MKIRKPAVAGAFYPRDKMELRKMVDDMLNAAPLYDIKGIRTAVSPHAGYVFSGPVAAYTYKQFYNLNLEKNWTVFLVGPSHYVYFSGASVGFFDFYETPLGLVKVSPIARKLLSEEGFSFVLDAHIEEHCLEVQLPFLQTVFQKFDIVPIIFSEITFDYLATVLDRYLTENSILLVSSDLSHYYPYETARKLDSHCNNAVKTLELSELDKCEACGKTGIASAIYLAKKHKWHSKVLMYATSGDTAGPKTQVVGYGSYMFFEGGI